MLPLPGLCGLILLESTGSARAGLQIVVGDMVLMALNVVVHVCSTLGRGSQFPKTIDALYTLGACKFTSCCFPG